MHLQIDEFYNVSRTNHDQKNFLFGGCNMEIELQNNIELPMYSNEDFECFSIDEFNRFQNIEEDITEEIISNDQLKTQQGILEEDK